MTVGRLAAVVVAGFCWISIQAAAAIAGGQVLDAVPDDLGAVAAFVGVDHLEVAPRGDLVEVARGLLAREGGLLLVGRTDPSGPRGLNLSLSVEMARTLSQRLRAALGVAPGRMACVGEGEASGVPPGVGVYGWRPPEPREKHGSHISLITPTRGAVGRRLWAFWARSDTVAWGTRLEGEKSDLWRLPSSPGKVVLPFPSLGTSTVVAAGDTVRADLGAVPLAGAVPDGSLAIRLVSRTPWTATLSGEAPPGVTEMRLWAAGIPYPALAGRDGRIGVQVALWPTRRSAWLETVGPEGVETTGIPVVLPAGQGTPPDLWAVLVWDDDRVDLDLHGWAGSGHTHPGAPDPIFTPGAVAGSRLLFDGTPGSPASALVVWGGDEFRIDVRCFSALGGMGTRARLYLVRTPGDPVSERRIVLGPRRLSEEFLERRWPALGYGGKRI